MMPEGAGNEKVLSKKAEKSLKNIEKLLSNAEHLLNKAENCLNMAEKNSGAQPSMAVGRKIASGNVRNFQILSRIFEFF